MKNIYAAALLAVLPTVAFSMEDNSEVYNREPVDNSFQVDAPRKRSLEDIQRAAAHGDVNAQYKLGKKYADGIGVEENYTMAADLFQQAANQGHAKAEFMLGILSIGGLGVSRDIETGIKLLQRAMDKGCPGAIFAFGKIYETGEAGFDKNEWKAADLILRAADLGYLGSQESLAKMYEEGRGVVKDAAKAAQFYKLFEQQ